MRLRPQSDFPLGRVFMTQCKSLCSIGRLAQCSLVILFLTPLSLVAQADDEMSDRRTRTVRAIQQAEPSVVNIEGNKPATTGTGSRSDTQQVNGMGAGVIIDARGYILTNQHVVQDVGRIEVTLHNGRQYVGRLIARDAETDLALVKIDARQDLPVINSGTSSDLMRGEPVIAIGNPFGYHHTVTEGIISALHRDIPVNGVQDYPDLIQTDASINPGNSGGPLLNANGYMIGINAAVRIGAQGIGFAIPVDRANEVAADMIAQHRRAADDQPLGVKTEYAGGKSFVVVADSSLDSVRRGDVIRKVSGKRVENRLQYELALLGQRSGSEVDLEVERGSEQVAARVKWDARSASTSRTTLASTSSVEDQIFRKMGLRLEPAQPGDVRKIDSSYKGGFRVTSVRENSPADAALIEPGDVLVGLMEWQTPGWDELEWIMKSQELRTASAPTFHIMRNSGVFFGTLDLNGKTLR